MEREWWLWRKRERRERRFGGADLEGEREREKGAQKRRPSTSHLAPRRFWSMTIQLRICSRICSWGPSFCVFSDGSLFTCDFIILLGCFSFSAGCVEGGQKHNATKRPPEKSSQPQEPSPVSVAQEQRPSWRPAAAAWPRSRSRLFLALLATWAGVHAVIWSQLSTREKNKKKKSN